MKYGLEHQSFVAKAHSQLHGPFSLWEEINEKTKMAFFKDKTKSCFFT